MTSSRLSVFFTTYQGLTIFPYGHYFPLGKLCGRNFDTSESFPIPPMARKPLALLACCKARLSRPCILFPSGVCRGQTPDGDYSVGAGCEMRDEIVACNRKRIQPYM